MPVIAAAIRKCGVIYTLPQPARHGDIIRLMADEHLMPTPIAGEQGFLDSELGFLDRKQAARRAIACGQITAL